MTINNPSLPFHKAIIDNDVESLENLINTGHDINMSDSHYNNTALHLGVKKGNILLVRQLLNYKASAEVYNKTGYTPLHLACHHEHSEIALELINYGARVNVINLKKNTPLHLAAQKKNPNIIKTLLNANADIDVKGSEGYTPLMISSSLGDYKAIILLLSKGADTSIRMSEKGAQAYNIAIQRGYHEIAELLNITSLSDFFCIKQDKEIIFFNTEYITKLAQADQEIKTALIDRFFYFNIKKLSLKNLPVNKLQLELNHLYSNLKYNISLILDELNADISFLEKFKENIHQDGCGFISLYNMCSLIHYDKILNIQEISNLPKHCVLDTFTTLSEFKVNNNFYNEAQPLLGIIYPNDEENT